MVWVMGTKPVAFDLGACLPCLGRGIDGAQVLERCRAVVHTHQAVKLSPQYTWSGTLVVLWGAKTRAGNPSKPRDAAKLGSFPPVLRRKPADSSERRTVPTSILGAANPVHPPI